MIVKSVQTDNALHNAVNDAITSDKPVKVKTNAGNAVNIREKTNNAKKENIKKTTKKKKEIKKKKKNPF